MRPSLLTNLALYMNGPQLTQLFASLRVIGEFIFQNVSTEEIPLPIRSLSDAPEEILTEILSRLDGFDLMRCLGVNRYFHKLINDSKLLQYKILLAKAHYHDGPRIKGDFLSSSAARASLLQTHIDGWRNLRHTGQALTLPLSSCKHFAQGVLTWAEGRVVHILELPSILRRTVSQPQRREFRVGFDPVGIFVNPAQDLLILAEYLQQKLPCPYGSATVRTKRTMFLHFKTLSDGRTHPQATRTIPLRISSPNIQMRCFGNLLSLAYAQPRTITRFESVCLEIVDWKQGQSLMKENLAEHGFVVAPFFLTRDLVMTCRTGVLCDYLVIHDISSGAFKEIVSLTVGGAMKRGTTRHMIIEGSSPADITSNSPFTIDDDSRIVRIIVNANERLWDDNDPYHRLFIDLAVPVHHLLCWAEVYKRLWDEPGTGEPCGPVPLEKWTARHAVMHIYRGPVEATPFAACGSRIASLLAGCNLLMEDFQPDQVRWVEGPALDNPSLKWKVLFPPGIKRPNLKSWYRTQYVYRASCVIPHLGTHEKATEIMMDEEHMIIIKVDDTQLRVDDLADLVIMSIQSSCGTQAD